MAEHIEPISQSPTNAQDLPIESPELQAAESMASEAMEQVQHAADRLRRSTTQRAAASLSSPELDGPVVAAPIIAELSMLSDVHLAMTVELGRTRMYVEDVLKLESGAVVELDKAAGDPVDILVNGWPVARGEVLVLDDTFCIRISEILTSGDPGLDGSTM
jgi:flagellar motor switch protein FliN